MSNALFVRISSALLIAGAPVGTNAVAQIPATEVSSSQLSPGVGSFIFQRWEGPPLKVHYYVPAGARAETPITFVMHGKYRDAERYLAEWVDLAEKHHFILAVPEFDKHRFPGSKSYNYGNFRGRDGRHRPRNQWSFSAIEPLFDEIRERTASNVPTYAIYGHSAGAQFVHRFVLFTPEARFHAAVSANAGAYAFPSFEYRFPFGLKRSPVDEEALRTAFAKPMIILLGTADTRTTHRSLPAHVMAMAQGPHRFARGRAFYAAAEAKAKELGVPFRWRLHYANGVGHNNGKMAASAGPLLAGPDTELAESRLDPRSSPLSPSIMADSGDPTPEE